MMKLLEFDNKIELYDEFIKIIITKKNFNNNLKFFSLKQIHSNKVIFLTQPIKSNQIEGDAIITKLKNYPICIKTADCLPIFIYSKKYKIISVVHSGWRGTSKKILKKVIDFFIKDLNLSLDTLFFVFGPCICGECYEVEEDMKQEFLKNFDEKGKNFFKKISDKKYLFDLIKANFYILETLGVSQNKIFNLNKCTICNNDEFYSFRKENTNKRILNIIQILEE